MHNERDCCLFQLRTVCCLSAYCMCWLPASCTVIFKLRFFQKKNHDLSLGSTVIYVDGSWRAADPTPPPTPTSAWLHPTGEGILLLPGIATWRNEYLIDLTFSVPLLRPDHHEAVGHQGSISILGTIATSRSFLYFLLRLKRKTAASL